MTDPAEHVWAMRDLQYAQVMAMVAVHDRLADVVDMLARQDLRQRG